jgi:hypothetical protein
MKQRTLICAFLAAVLGLAASHAVLAEEAAPGTSPTWSPWTFDVILRLLGADVGVGYRGLSLVPGTQTIFWVYGGGGSEGQHYYRDPNGGLLAPGSIASENDASFNRIEGAWRLGIEQGFAWNPRTSTNLLAAFLFYRGRYDLNQGLSTLPDAPPLGVLPDRDSSILNTLQLGLAYDNLLTTRHHVKDGVSAETTVEWGPSFLFNTIQGDSDFVRFNAMARWFVPLYDAEPDRPHNLFSVYLGEYAEFDYAMGLNGTRVPLYIRQTFGGRSQNTALGAQVRGVDKGAYDTNLKAVNNLEVRANLPAIPMPDFISSFVPDLVTGLVAYFDSGFYDQVGEPGIASPPSGFVATVGAGPYIDIPALGFLLLYVEYRLDAANAAGDRLRFALELGAQF